MVTVGGRVTGDVFEAKGTLDVGATVEIAERFETDGTTRIVGSCRAAEVTLRGTTRIGAEVRVERLLHVHGSLSAPEVHAGVLLVEGSLDVPKEVSATEVDATFRAPSHLGIVRARSVRLTLRPANPVEMVLGRRLPVSVDRIEAETVHLEAVDVGFVRATEIVLGRNAHVIAYEGSIVRRHPSARVGPESRSPPPHGLSR
jgi:cytoskeletal protein CcmA (bactofilin family)